MERERDGKWLIAKKSKDKVVAVSKITTDIASLFIQRGKEGEAIVLKEGTSYTPKYKWVEKDLVWRPMFKWSSK